jgi:hypothetical protein
MGARIPVLLLVITQSFEEVNAFCFVEMRNYRVRGSSCFLQNAFAGPNARATVKAEVTPFRRVSRKCAALAQPAR